MISYSSFSVSSIQHWRFRQLYSSFNYSLFRITLSTVEWIKNERRWTSVLMELETFDLDDSNARRPDLLTTTWTESDGECEFIRNVSKLIMKIVSNLA